MSLGPIPKGEPRANQSESYLANEPAACAEGEGSAGKAGFASEHECESSGGFRHPDLLLLWHTQNGPTVIDDRFGDCHNEAQTRGEALPQVAVFLSLGSCV